MSLSLIFSLCKLTKQGIDRAVLLCRDPLNKLLAAPQGSDLYSRMQTYFAKGENARLHAESLLSTTKMTFQERVEHDSVLSAANTIAMAFLAGVILLQVSEWYLEETIVKEAEAEAKKLETAAPVTEEKKTQ